MWCVVAGNEPTPPDIYDSVSAEHESIILHVFMSV